MTYLPNDISKIFSDIDNDGYEDMLLSGNYFGNYITKLYKNDGLGDFIEMLGTPFIGVKNSSIAFSDIDNDGDEDLLITGDTLFNGVNGYGLAVLYKNDGLGNFTEVIGTPFIGVRNGSVAFSDIDNDGDEDLLITGDTLYSISSNGYARSVFYTNDGLGNFTEMPGIPFYGAFAGSIAFSDIDNDGDEDLLISGDINAMNNYTPPFSSTSLKFTQLYTNDGLGNFSSFTAPFNNWNSNGISLLDIVFSDIDNDGDEDLLLNNNMTYLLYTNDGFGNFTEVIGTPIANTSSTFIKFSDTDNDGDKDCVMKTNFGLIAYANDGLGNFNTFSYSLYQAGSPGFKTFALSDVDNDGDEDLLIIGLNASTWVSKLYTNNFGMYIEAMYPTTIPFGSFAFSDVDNDGDEDLFVMPQTSGGELYLNNGGTYFSFSGSYIMPMLNMCSIAFSDIDNDGDEDLLISGRPGLNTPVTFLYANDGLGNFTGVTAPFLGVQQSAIAFSDIDNDGDEDVIISGYTAYNIITSKLYTNDGLGNFSEVIGTPFTGVHSCSIAFSDIDNDGDEDVIITGADINVNISKLYTNDGLGNFTEVIGTPFIEVRNSSVAFSDIDNDGDKDLLISGKTVGQFGAPLTKLYTNDGLGNFTEVIGTPFIGTESGSIAFSDVDNDGDKDLMITGNGSILYTNDGLGNFTEVIGTPFIGTQQGSVAFSDVDNDGDEDLLISGTTSLGQKSFWYRNIYHLGCTDLLACNYDATAALDDSSCVYSNTTSTYIVTCNSYFWNGTIYSSSGIYDTVLTNIVGCDSIATLNLTINNSTTSTDTQLECDTYTWIDGIIYTASNNTSTHTVTNTVGCDSVIILDLTITNSNSSIATETACISYFWNGTSYSSSGTYDTTIINSVGCDSVVSLNLTITGNPFATIVQNGIDLEVTYSTYYNWNTSATTQTITPTNNGTYWCIVTDANGCTSDTSFFEVTNIINGLNEITNSNRKLLKVVDVLGKDINPKKVIEKTTLFYIYDDGTVEKIITIE